MLRALTSLTLALFIGLLASGPCYAQLDRWNVSVGSILLHRDTPDPRTLIATTNGTPVLDASQFDFGIYGGVDFYITRQLNEFASTEFRYFGIGDALSFASVNGATSIQFLTNPPSGEGTQAMFNVNGTYLSNFHSTEADYRRQLCSSVDLILGFRWIELHEQIRVNSSNNIGIKPSPMFFNNVDNHL